MDEERKNLVERVSLTRAELIRSEREIIIHEHIRRYAAVRRFCYGRTLDFACGCGYGSFLLAANPDISEVIGVDQSEEVIAHAKAEFSSEKITFSTDLALNDTAPIDTLVSLETIEHLTQRSTLPEIVRRSKIDNVIVSFPDKPTTHYNRFHKHDFVAQEIVDLFQEHFPYHWIRFTDSQVVLLMRLPQRAPWRSFRNLGDVG